MLCRPLNYMFLDDFHKKVNANVLISASLDNINKVIDYCVIHCGYFNKPHVTGSRTKKALKFSS